MRKLLWLGAIGATLSVAAYAVGDIPTRYSGAFPTDGQRKNITGTFTGKSITLNFTSVPKSGSLRRTFAGTCATTSPTQTRCAGRIRGSGSDNVNIAAEVTVTWGGGKPTSVAFSK